MKGVKKLLIGLTACCIAVSSTAISACSGITITPTPDGGINVTPNSSTGAGDSSKEEINSSSSITSGEKDDQEFGEGLGSAVNLITGGYTDLASGTVSIFDEEEFAKLERKHTDIMNQQTDRTYEEDLNAYLDELVLDVNGKINRDMSIDAFGLFKGTQGFDFGVNVAYEKTFSEETTTAFFDLTYKRIQWREEIKGYKSPENMLSILSDDFLRHAKMVNNGEMSPKQFIGIYGTHIITAAIYGAKCDVHYELYGHTSKTNEMFAVDGEVDLYNGLSFAIDGMFNIGLDLGGGVGVDVSYLKDSVSKNLQTKFTATSIGGEAKDFSNNSLEGAAAPFTEWINSLNKENNENYVLIDVPDESLYCVWDFLDDSYSNAKQILTQYLYDACNERYETLKAKMGELYKDGCNVSLDKDDGSDLQVHYVKGGESLVLPTPTRTGYTFLGWYDENGYKVADEITPTVNVTYTAKWQANKYEVQYEARGGSISTSKTEVTYGQLYEFSVPTKQNEIFLGWFTLDGKRLTDKNGKSNVAWGLAEDCIVYAQWGYTVTLNTDGGTNGGEYYVPTGENFELPSSEAYGRVFLGWYDSSDKKYEGTIKPTSDLVLTAKWLQTEELVVSLNRQSCRDNSGYDPATNGGDGANKSHSNFELVDLTIRGCTRNGNGNYIVATGNTLSIDYRMIQNPTDLPRGAGSSLGWWNWYAHNIASDTYSGNIKGTDINAETIGKGAYYVKINYTDGQFTESHEVNAFADMSQGMLKTLNLNLSTEKQVQSIEIVFVYELYYEHYTNFAWQSGYTNWRCSTTLNFE